MFGHSRLPMQFQFLGPFPEILSLVLGPQITILYLLESWGIYIEIWGDMLLLFNQVVDLLAHTKHLL